MSVTTLFVKRVHGAPLAAVREFAFGPQGIADGVASSPLRHVLITARSVTRDGGLAPGDLRENIEVDVPHLYDLPSGTVIRIGEALIRLTFHCEPCRKIMHLVGFDQIVHKRGYLGAFLNSGTIALGDVFAVTEQTLEAIPYAVKDRLRWFFGKRNAALAALDLVHALGLPASSARVVPGLVAAMGLKWR